MTNKSDACLVAVVRLLFGLLVRLGVNCLLAWCVTIVVRGLFGHEVPFWPTVLAIFLFQALLGGTRIVLVRSEKGGGSGP
jgi:hypothetical protein